MATAPGGSEAAGTRRARPRRRRRAVGAGVAAGLLAFLAVMTLRTRPPSPVLRAPRQYQLAALVDRQQADIAVLRRQLSSLRSEADRLRRAVLGTQAGRSSLEDALNRASQEAGLVAVRGPAVKVTLGDSTQATAPDVNDLVIHSQDLQAVINALWRAGAEAIAVDGERVVSVSAVECVGNTLLLDGTVKSPPYDVVGIGSDQGRFSADPLVKELAVEASTYGLVFDVTSVGSATAPAYNGQVVPRYASVAPRSAR